MPKFEKSTGYKMKGFTYPGISPLKIDPEKATPEGHMGDREILLPPNVPAQEGFQGGYTVRPTKEDTPGMEDISLNRDFDMSRWVK